MISSGDSGSGYTSDDSTCDTTNAGASKGVGINGHVVATHETCYEINECCSLAAVTPGSKGWSYVPPTDDAANLGARVVTKADATAMQRSAPTNGSFAFDNAEYHVAGATPTSPFKNRDLFYVNGKVTLQNGGTVKATSPNATATTVITFAGPAKVRSGNEATFNLTGTFGGTALHGQAIFFKITPSSPWECMDIQWRFASGIWAIWERGGNPPPPPPAGTCTVYDVVTSKTQANSTTFSGFPSTKPPQLWASWPASSPWVTAVGATRFVGQTVGNAEMATDQFGSGGGFSKMFDQTNAKWQSAAVAKYLSTVDASTLPPASSYNAHGRATPDVSVLGEGYQVFVGGKTEPVGGTSASSPAFAGLISLLNEARMTAGKPPLGFLNPFLYQNEGAFTDVTEGSNKVDRGGAPMPYGYNCSAGWDPATGLGTPLFDKLMVAAMKV